MSFDKMSTDEKIKKPFITPILIPEPHFISGYTGFCPGLPGVVGASYGHVTNEILKENPKIASRLLPTAAAVAHPARRHERELEQEKRDKKVINSRFPQEGRRVLNDYMMPGYTGHVPNSSDAVGVNFTRGCIKSISKFIREQQAEEKDAKSPKP